MRATVDVVLDNPDSTAGDLRAMAADIRAAVDHAEHLIGALLLLARNERGLTVREKVDLAHGGRGRAGRRGLGLGSAARPLAPARGAAGARHAGACRHLGRSGAGRTAGREPGRQRGPVQPRRRATSGSARGTVAGGCELTVANTGPVVDPADVGRIFQPFERLSDRTSHDGFGLGLAIVASIAAIHGGTAIALSPRRRRPVRHGHHPLGRRPGRGDTAGRSRPGVGEVHDAGPERGRAEELQRQLAAGGPNSRWPEPTTSGKTNRCSSSSSPSRSSDAVRVPLPVMPMFRPGCCLSSAISANALAAGIRVEFCQSRGRQRAGDDVLGGAVHRVRHVARLLRPVRRERLVGDPAEQHGVLGRPSATRRPARARGRSTAPSTARGSR